MKKHVSKYGSMRANVEKHYEHQEAMHGFSTIRPPKGVEVYKPKIDTTVRFDIVPYVVKVKNHPIAKEGRAHYQRTYYMHRDVGIEKQAVVCPKKTFGRRCPICEEIDRMNRDPKADEKVLKGLLAKRRELFNIRMQGEEAIQLLDISWHNFGKELDTLVQNKEENAKGFADPGMDGKTLRVRWQGETMGSGKPFPVGRIDLKDRQDPVTDEEIEAATDLDGILIEKSYEELSKLFNMTEDDDDDAGEDKDEEEDNIPLDDKEEQEDEEQEEEEQDSEEEDDEEEQEEDEDEEQEEDEDEEDDDSEDEDEEQEEEEQEEEESDNDEEDEQEEDEEDDEEDDEEEQNTPPPKLSRGKKSPPPPPPKKTMKKTSAKKR